MLIILSSTLLSSCTIPPLKEIYKPYQQTPDVNPIIIIPGIKGSELKNNKNQNVWGGWLQIIPSNFDDLKLYAIDDEKLNNDNNFEVFNQSSIVKASAVFRRWRLLSILGKSSDLDIYDDLYETLKNFGNYVDADNQIEYDDMGNLNEVYKNKSAKINETNKNRAIFSFYYDWRRDNILNAVNLGKFIKAIKKTYYSDQDKVQFDIVAHSMGGLIARFYVGYHSFCDRADKDPTLIYRSIHSEMPDTNLPDSIHKVILLGTPNGGSMTIFHAFYDGSGVETLSKKKVWNIIPTMPSAYELLPQCCIGECFLALKNQPDTQNFLKQTNDKAKCDPQNGKFSIFDHDVWQDMEWSAFSKEWEQDGLQKKKQRLISKGLARAEEFTYLLKKTSNTNQKYFILLGGDCASTLHKGLLYEPGKEEMKPNSTKQNKRKVVFEESELKRIYKYNNENFESTAYFKPGDGVVPRAESMLTLTPASASFACQSHGSLFKDDTLKDNLLYELLIKDRGELKEHP